MQQKKMLMSAVAEVFARQIMSFGPMKRCENGIVAHFVAHSVAHFVAHVRAHCCDMLRSSRFCLVMLLRLLLGLGVEAPAALLDK